MRVYECVQVRIIILSSYSAPALYKAKSGASRCAVHTAGLFAHAWTVLMEKKGFAL